MISEKTKSLYRQLMFVKRPGDGNYFDVLDGWRGISILFVLAAHLLPLGPKALRLNETAGPIGMAIFFTLSGFLITNFLIHRPNVHHFIVRRFFRIIPLAWIYLAIALPFLGVSITDYAAHFFFYGNWPSEGATTLSFSPGTSHFWSLCVEMQFYVGIALLFSILKDKALLLIPILCLLITFYRIHDHVYISINTYYRMDEILVGCVVALAYNQRLGSILPDFFRWVNPYYVLVLFLLSCHPDSGAMNYIRPYLAATLVASTVFNPRTEISNFLNLRVLAYLAAISYALYVIHPLLVHSWLGEGDLIEKYAKRPLLFAVLFALAHLSTFYYEKYWIDLAKRLTLKKS
jgi:peptidoglycan/LPS O-acetylase OafA/YrhL